MLRRHHKIRAQIHRVIDAALYGAAFWLAFRIRAGSQSNLFKGLSGIPDIGRFEDYSYLIPVLLPVAFLVFTWQGFYVRPLNCSRRETFWPLFKSCVIVTGCLILAGWFRHTVNLSRAVVLLSAPIAFGFIFLKEEIIRLSYLARFGSSEMKRRLILVGAAGDLVKLRQELGLEMAHEAVVVKEIDLGETSVEVLIDYLHEHSVNGVVLNARHVYFGLVEKVIQACELEGVEVWLMADFFKTQISRTTLDDLYGKPVLVFRSTPDTSWQSMLKIIFDRAAALVLLVPASLVLFPLVALAIKLRSPGPVFFKQRRSGLNGRPFTMYKFRSMATDAEQRRHELAAMNEMTGPVFKVTGDPRITPVGRCLRKWSIDEVPQLWNVLLGEMSIVGPRPLPVDEVKLFDDLAHRRRLSVKPGLTCLWQVRGRNNVTDFKDWVRMDLEYIDNWSIWLDFKIVCQTVPVVLFARGAK